MHPFSTSLTAALPLIIGSVASLISSSGCSNEFMSCEATRTCPHSADASSDDGAMDASAVNSSGGTGGLSPTLTGGSSGALSTGGANGVLATGGTQSTDAGAGSSTREASTTDGATKSDAGDASAPKGADATAADGAEAEAGLSCPTQWRDCNGLVDDGCETNIDEDVEHCGACHDPCSSAGVATRACVDGMCQLDCQPDFQDCNGNVEDGCEVDVTSDPDHCGACGDACSATGAATRSCVNGVCEPTCKTNRADCNDDGRDGCEVSLTSDPDNCGQCDRVCSGTNAATRVCQAKECQPSCNTGFADCTTPASPSADNGCETILGTEDNCSYCGHDCLGGGCYSNECRAVVLATVRKTPRNIAVDDMWVHWTEGGTSDGQVMRVHRTDEPPITATPVATSQAYPTGIAAGNGYVYWANGLNGSSAIRRVLSGSSSATTLATNVSEPDLDWPNMLTYHDGTLYWTDDSSKTIHSMPANDGPVIALGGSTSIFMSDLAVDDTHVYFTTLPLYRMTRNGANTEMFGTNTSSERLTLDDDYVYLRTLVSGVSILTRIHKVTRVQEELAPLTGLLKGLAVVNGTLYYVTSDGVYRLPVTGGTPDLIASEVDNPMDMAVTPDGREVYWTNQGDYNGSTGTVYRLAL